MNMPQDELIYNTFMLDIIEHPTDWRNYLIFADWCSDKEKIDEEMCLRWLAANSRKCYTYFKKKEGEEKSEGKYVWFDETKALDHSKDDTDGNIPTNIFEKLEGGKKVANHVEYESASEALEALFKAWRKKDELARKNQET